MFFINPFILSPAGGDFESIATVTVGSGGASSIEFTSIPGTYQHLQVRMLANVNGTVSGFPDVLVQFNSVTTYTEYASHTLGGDGSSAYASSAVSSDSFTGGLVGDCRDSTAPIGGTGKVIDIIDYANTSKNKTVRTLSGWDGNGSGQLRLVSSVWLDTSAITSVKFVIRNATNTFVQHSTAALYGIKAP